METLIQAVICPKIGNIETIRFHILWNLFIMKTNTNSHFLPLSQCSPVNPEGHKQRYRLLVNPD